MLTLYTTSIDRSILKRVFFMRSFDDVAPNAPTESLTSEQFKKYLERLIQSKEAYSPARLREAMTGLYFPVNITDPSSQIIIYCTDAFDRYSE